MSPKDSNKSGSRFKMHGDSVSAERARRLLPILVRQAIAGKPLTYKAVSEELGMEHHRPLTFPLDIIMQDLIEAKEELGEAVLPLTSLVVGEDTGLPAKGFFDALRGETSEWYRDQTMFTNMPPETQRKLKAILYAGLKECDWLKVLHFFGIDSPEELSFANRPEPPENRPRRGLTSITIENFKGISESVTVPLKPLTLLFGANSSGKSTVLHAFLYAYEVLIERNLNAFRTVLGGESIDLGGFQSLVHGRDSSRRIRIQLNFYGHLRTDDYVAYENLYPMLPDLQDAYEPGNADLATWTDLIDVDFAIGIEVAWNRKKREAYLSEYSFDLWGERFGIITADELDEVRIEVNAEHPYLSEENISKAGDFGEALKFMYEEFASPSSNASRIAMRMEPEERTAFIEELESALHDKEKRLPAEREDHSYSSKRLNGEEALPRWGTDLRFGPDEFVVSADAEDPETTIYRSNSEDLLAMMLSQLFMGAGEAAVEELKGLRYIGPLREVVPRNYTPGRGGNETLSWDNGLRAWERLAERPKFSEHDILEKCNSYMKDVLKLKYELRRKESAKLTADELYAIVRLFAPQYDDVEEEQFRARVLDHFNDLPILPQVTIWDMEHEVEVSPDDIGTGISELIPVLVGAVDTDCKLFAVEQPELHVHPAIQVNLGDVLLRELLEGKDDSRVFLMETHSEHLVLRIMRRMRETFEGTLPVEFPSITPDDVAVLYVENVDGPDDESRTVVREMPLNERGELVKAWPGGFFEEGLQETL